MELSRLRVTAKSRDHYHSRAENAITNVLDCFHGNHSNCRKVSAVCISHLKTYKMTYLPYGQYMKLSTKDREIISKVISQYCGAKQLKETENLFNTNKCENLHSRLFSIAPKSTVWSRNFPGLCHAASLGASIGRGISLLLIAQHVGLEIGVNDPIYKYAKNCEKISMYHANRKRSFQYKSTRYSKRRRIANRELFKQSLYKSTTVASADHSYGINLG